MELREKRVVVIGGSSGVGLALASAAAREGAKVLIAGRCVEKLAGARERLGGKVATYPLDVTQETEIERFFSRVGTLDHLVTSLGGALEGPISVLSEDRVQGLFEKRFWGQHRSARHAAPRIVSGGSITFISGDAAARPAPGRSAEAAADGAIAALCGTLALELAPVRVNTLCLGSTPAAGSFRVNEEAAEAALFFLCNSLATGIVLPLADGARSV